MNTTRGILWVALIAISAGCSASFDVPPEALIRCASADDCPPGWVCRATGRCVSSDNLDEDAPVFLAGPKIDPARISREAGHDRVEVTFTLDEEIGEAPAKLQVSLGETELECTSRAAAKGFAHTCAYRLTADDAPGAHAVTIVAADRAGNVAEESGVVEFDFTPPEVLSATVTYLPAADSPLASIAKATAGTVIQLVLGAGEPLDTEAPVTLAAKKGADEITFTAVSVDGFSAVLEGTVPDGAADGVYAPVLSWTDAAGNHNKAATFSAPTIVVKTSKPVLLVDQSMVTYHRSPWGRAIADDLGGAVLPAGPVFELAPADPLAPDLVIPASAFRLEGDAALPLVRAWGDANATMAIGTVRPAAEGWPRQRLLAIDLPAVYVTGVDEAGNESAAVLVENAEWVATPYEGAVPGPHLLEKAAYARSTLRSKDAVVAPVIDATAHVQAASPAWNELPRTAVTPAGRYNQTMTYDAARGVTVVYGGYDDIAGIAFGETWEWDGFYWNKRTPATTPGGRVAAGMVFDSRRGRVVLFGGISGAERADLWEWDGERWLERQAAQTPPARFGHGMAYDSERGRLVLFGGVDSLNKIFQDTWEWDGEAWHELQPAKKPTGRRLTGMTYDPVRKRTVLYGGCATTSPCGQYLDDVWEWDGASWRDATPSAGGPGGRVGAQLAYHQDIGRVVVFGGNEGGAYRNDLWQWDGVKWTAGAVAGGAPAPRGYQPTVYDRARSRLVVFAGADTGAFFDDLWEYDGARWWDVTPTLAWPPPITEHAMVRDAGRNRVLIYGGWTINAANKVLDELWEWDGGRWDLRCDGSPPADVCAVRPPPYVNPTMAHDPVRKRTVLVGDCGDLDCVVKNPKIWEWDGAAWVQRCDNVVEVCPGAPDFLADGAMGWHAGSKRIVFVSLGLNFAMETREWDGVAWTVRCDGVPASDVCPELPPARMLSHMAYDAARDRLVMYGGCDPDTCTQVMDDQWEWDGARWYEVTPAAPRPEAVSGAALSQDEASRRVVLFGGFLAPESGLANMTRRLWSLDGDRWTELTPPSGRPGPRANSAMAFDASHDGLMLFGGVEGALAMDDAWILDLDGRRHPAIQVTADASGAGFDQSQIEGLRARAWCGGEGGGKTGARLEAFASGGFVPLGTNATAVGAAANDGKIAWSAADSAEARRYFLEADALMAARCTPLGDTGDGPAEAEVGLSHIELRIRYRAAP